MTVKTQSTVKQYDLVGILRASPKEVVKCLVKSLGQKVKKGELVACKKGFFKKQSFFAPIEGTLDSLTEEGILRIKISTPQKAKIKPPFSEEEATQMKGEWGKGGQALGELFCLEKEARIFNLKGKHQDQILALFGRLNRGLWHKAKSIGIKGIICGGLPDKNFGNEVEKEVLLVGGKKKDIALPLVVLGEKGEIPQDIWQVLVKNQGKKVWIEGDQHRVLIPK